MNETHFISRSVSGAQRLWHCLTELPLASKADGRQAALLMGLIPLVPLLAILFVAFNPARDALHRLAALDAAAVVVVLLLAYVVNRRGHFIAAAWLAVSALTGGVLVAALADPAHNLSALKYLVLPILLSSALLPLLGTAAFSAAIVIFMAALASSVPPELIREVPITFTLSAASVALLTTYYCSKVECDRRAALAASEARWHTVFMEAPTGMAIVDDEKRFLRVNTRLRRMLDYTEAELLQCTLLDVVHPEDRDILSQASVETSGTLRLELRCITRTGAPLWVRLSASTLRDPTTGESQRLLMVQDISARREAERQAREAERLRLALEQERELRAYKMRFTSAVSHEFRTPLSVILASDEILQRYGDRLAPEQKANHHHLIQEQVQRLTRMVDTLLAAGRAADLHGSFEPQPLDPVAFCGALADELLVADSYQHALTFTHTGAFDGFHADRYLLQLAIGSLLENAFKSTPAGGEVRLALHGAPEGVTFTVSDTGAGIPSEDQPYLFEPFHRAEGANLGLYLVKVCAERHGGTVSFESRPNQGTTFILRLPLRAGNPIETQAEPTLL